ncbi:unnamed protein product, partial [Mesorhabditis belari]|uniref:Uncharacterized protein n=1 Tax=Mesorhabditis belari TaxID=2138241 RepID=A0AAF3FMH8_9BILA
MNVRTKYERTAKPVQKADEEQKIRYPVNLQRRATCWRRTTRRTAMRRRKTRKEGTIRPTFKSIDGREKWTTKFFIRFYYSTFDRFISMPNAQELAGKNAPGEKPKKGYDDVPEISLDDDDDPIKKSFKNEKPLGKQSKKGKKGEEKKNKATIKSEKEKDKMDKKEIEKDKAIEKRKENAKEKEPASTPTTTTPSKENKPSQHESITPKNKKKKRCCAIM